MKKFLTILTALFLGLLFSSCEYVEDYNEYDGEVYVYNYTTIPVKVDFNFKNCNVNVTEKKSMISSWTEETDTLYCKFNWIPERVYYDIDGFASSFTLKYTVKNEFGKNIYFDYGFDSKSIKKNESTVVKIGLYESKLPCIISADLMDEELNKITDEEDYKVFNDLYSRSFMKEEYEIIHYIVNPEAFYQNLKAAEAVAEKYELFKDYVVTKFRSIGTTRLIDQE